LLPHHTFATDEVRQFKFSMQIDLGKFKQVLISCKLCETKVLILQTINTTTTTPLNGLFFQDNLGKPAPQRYTNLRGWGGNGISWTICKSFAVHARQITTPIPQYSVFYRPDALPAAQPTASKH